MEFRPLGLAGAYEIRNVVHGDGRGEFAEWFRFDTIEAETGYRFPVRQANVSRSQKGVVRGIHFCQIPPGQAKLVTCMTGRILDIVVDVRDGSATFGQWKAAELSAAERNAMLLPVGVGHAFVALDDITTVCYAAQPQFIERADGLFDGRVGVIEVPPERALDIDTEFDFRVAEALMTQRQ